MPTQPHKPPRPVAPRGSSLAGKAFWAMVQRVALTAACIDLGYIGLFLWLGSVPLALVNLGSIALYLGAYALIQRRRNGPGLVLIWAEVIGHSALGSLLIGWDSGFHYYLLLFIPAIVIANAGRYAVPIVVALLAYYVGLRALCDHLGPLDPLPGQGMQIVNWIHICIAFALSASVAAFYRRTILIAEGRLLKQEVAERIRQAVEATTLELGEGNAPLQVTLSFGVTHVQGTQDLKAATARADRGLYASKRAGRNCVSVDVG
eukprot:gene9380-9191_t